MKKHSQGTWAHFARYKAEINKPEGAEGEPEVMHHD